MNELHKYATFSVDLLGTPKKINSVFSIGRARIFYKGINRNRSIIDGEVAEKLASTIPGTPIIGTFNYETNDFEGHEDNPSAFGFVPLDPHSEWVKYNDKEYLEVDVVIWDGRFEEAADILKNEKHLSMELNPKTLRGSFEKIGSKTYYKMSYAEFAGITVLGDDVEPCFEDAQFITAYSNMVSAYALYIEKTQRNNEGGKNIMEEITEIVEPEVTTETVEETVEIIEETPAEEVAEETPVVEEVTEEAEVEEVVETESVETVVEPEVEAEVIADAEIEEEAAETEIVETIEESEADFESKEKEACSECRKNPCVCENACNKDKSKCATEEQKEVCPECGKEPCVCENACNKNKTKCSAEEQKEKKESNEDEYVLKADYEALEQKYNEALSSLNKYTKKEKLEIIAKFSTKLESEELIEKLTNEVDNYTIAEIKTELGNALVEQISAEEDETEESSNETNFSLNINLSNNDLGNSAWDLVKRHKESK